MRVLHVANFSWFAKRRKRADDLGRYYTMERKISNGLTRNGCSVWDFSYRDTARALSPLGMGKKMGAARMEEHLLGIARQFVPDIILLGHCEILSGDTLMRLRDALPGCKIAQWWVDWFIERNLPPLREKQPLLDTFFATTAPAAYAELVGQPPANSRGHAPHYYLPNIIDSSVETGKAFSAERYEYDVVFAGGETEERKSILAMVAALPGVRCGFFGVGGEGARGGAHLMRALAASKIGLNLSQTDLPLYSSDRIAQMVGNGVMAVVPRVPDFERLFSEDEVAYCDTAADIPAVVQHYLADDAARRRVAEAGWRRGHASYNEQRVAKFMVEAVMGGEFSESYEWI